MKEANMGDYLFEMTIIRFTMVNLIMEYGNFYF